jgi:hypothetical protein
MDTLYRQSVTTPYSQTIEIDGIRHAIPIGKDILAQDAVYADLMDRARSALAQPEPQGLPPGYIDPEHTGADRHLLQVFYRACQSEGGTADEINLRGIRAVLADAALAQPEPQGVSEEELQRRFLAWWHNEGSGLPPLPGHDHEEHARRVSEIAWSNGAYVSHYCRPVIEPENQS